MVWTTDCDARDPRRGINDALDGDPCEEQGAADLRRRGDNGEHRDGWYSGTTSLQKVLFVLVLVVFMTTMMQPLRTCPNDSKKMLVATWGADPNARRATSNSSEKQSLPALVPNLCYVHIGKTGGGSIAEALITLVKEGYIGGLVNLHGSTTAAGLNNTYVRSHVWDAQVGKFVRATKGILRSFEKENSGSVRHVRPYKMNMDSRAECAKMGNVFTWIRDPVSRFVSVWNFQTTVINQTFLQNYAAADLETLIGNLKKEGLPKAWEFFGRIAHVGSDISFYLGEKDRNMNAWEMAWEDRSKSCKAILNSMPFVFVGRSEHTLSDWDALLKLLPPGANQVALKQRHTSTRAGKRLSRDSIDFIRSLHASDYRCITEMVEMGLVDESYLHYILSDEREYTF